MSGWSANAVQDAVYEALKGDALIRAMVSDRVYDDVPDQPMFPYIALGDNTFRDHSEKDRSGLEVELNIHVYSRKRGKYEVQKLQGHIYRVLHDRTLPTDGHQIVTCRLDMAHSFLEPDARTRQGVQRFALITTPQ